MNEKGQKSGATGWVVGLIVLILAFVVIGVSRKSTSAKTSRQVALTCTTDMATQFHIHPQLEIIVGGKPQVIPANIGIDLNCMHPLHTHDTSGTIHVESPEKKDFTLGDFFVVWGKPLPTPIIRETINGVEVKDYANTIFRDKDQIVISY